MLDVTQKIVRLVKTLLSRFGLDLVRLRTIQNAVGGDQFSFYQATILAMLTAQDRLRIVQVGANDGAINDPIFRIATEFQERIDILLIEPQQELLPLLRENYARNASAVVSNFAIGSSGEMTLFGVDPIVWPELRVSYAKDWPNYRAPSGIVSASKTHVENWLKHHYKGPIAISTLVTKRKVSSLPLMEVLERAGFGRDIDILQVDAEGHDDEVLYHSAIGELRPKMINFERHSLPNDRLKKLNSYLISLGYEVFEWQGDSLAILRSPNKS